jgi:CO dehydrogenase maturation factor
VRIAFLGKGGAGKTTTTASFVEYLAQRHELVIAVDADVNVHLQESLRLEGKANELGECFDLVAEKLKGERTDLDGRPMISSTPPSLRSNFIRPSFDDSFIQEYGLRKENVVLLTVGPYSKGDVGGNCYHSKLGSYTMILHHLLDTESDVIVADTTAGTDNVATSLNLAYDLNVFVVEPTMKSLSVYRDFLRLVPHLQDRVYVIANKIEDSEDLKFLQDHIPSDRLLGAIPFSKNLKRFEQGQDAALADFHKEQEEVFGKLYTVLCARKRNWSEYLQLLRGAHEKNSVDWYNDYYSTDLGTGYDPDFSYEKVLTNHGSRVGAALSAAK